jgi:hypothetical protein
MSDTDDLIARAEQEAREAKSILRAARAHAARIVRKFLRKQQRCANCGRRSDRFYRCVKCRKEVAEQRARHSDSPTL